MGTKVLEHSPSRDLNGGRFAPDGLIEAAPVSGIRLRGVSELGTAFGASPHCVGRIIARARGDDMGIKVVGTAA